MSIPRSVPRFVPGWAWPLLVMLLLAAGVAVAAPARAHGYVSTPPSRQALCADGTVPDCGQAGEEPQNVEAPKGSKLCSGGDPAFAALDDETRDWPTTAVGDEVTFSWTLVDRPTTNTWVYYVDGQRVASIDDDGAVPAAIVTHQVDVSAYSGEHTVLAVWNVADSPNAFYSCVDLDIGALAGAGDATAGPGDQQTGEDPDGQTTDGLDSDGADATDDPADPDQVSAVQTSAPASTTGPGVRNTAAVDRGDWLDWTWYEWGDQVTYQGLTYVCRQEHTALPGWEPSTVPALWGPA